MPVDVAGGLDSLSFEFREEETVDRIFGPGGVLDDRGGRVRDRLEGPEFTAGFKVDGTLRVGSPGRIARARIGGSALHPFFEDGDFVRR